MLIIFVAFIQVYKYMTPVPYNVVMIISDSLRADVLSCYDGEAKTPNIDRLAENGVLFKNAYSTSPYTPPSSVSMFIGEYPDIYRNGILPGKMPLANFRVPDKDLLLAKQLRKVNYDVRKDVENRLAGLYNNLQGFENLKTYQDISDQDRKQILKTTGLEINRYTKMHGFLDYILKTSETKPFFLLKWITDPHAPYNPPGKFKNKIIIDQARLRRDKKNYSKMSLMAAGLIGGLTDYEQKYLKELYLKEVESVDERVGYVIKALKEKNLLDKTIVVFASDHGEAFKEHGEWGHGQNYFNELVRIPFIIAGPGIRKGFTENANISLLDLTVSLRDLLNLAYEDKGQGISFAPLVAKNRSEQLNTDNWDKRPIYYIESKNRKKKYQDAVLLGHHKLITLKDDTKELYDLLKDPQELTDISSESAVFISQLSERLKGIRKDNQNRRLEYFGKKDQDTNSERKVDKKTLQQIKSLGYLR